MAKLRKVQSAPEPVEEVVQEPSTEEVNKALGAINLLDGYLENLEESNKNIVDALEQLSTRELTDAERANLKKMVKYDLAFTASISKKIKRNN